MEIRRAVPDDSSGIEQIETLSFPDPLSKKDIFTYICSEGGTCFVAVEDGEVIAYVIGRMIAPEGEIYRIATHPSKRGRGIGYRLLSYMTKTERARGLECVFLEVRSKNAPAISLYTSFGFEKIGERKNYYKNPDDDAIIMAYGHF
ncbi:MAG: ribosomal protein S18-alanine N-acetyltransferase [Clostridia bacterium]|nr:ribosomal protein S18-alanine N-acetyltransferase [Clostridia bacterium]